MCFSIMFFVRSIMLGIGLAMDAFSVSLANGLNETTMKKGKMCKIAGVFGFFQALMPMIGWVCVHTIVRMFNSTMKFIPWIALVLLVFIGGKMLIEGIRGNDEDISNNKLTNIMLLVQGIATSIDALSVGFTISSYSLVMAFVCAMIIAIVTFIICIVGLKIGKKVGMKFSKKATILGEVILIIIGIEIFLDGLYIIS